MTDEFDSDIYLQKLPFGRRCDCKKYSLFHGRVISDDGFFHARKLCQPIRESILDDVEIEHL